METKYKIGQLVRIADSECLLFRVSGIVIEIYESGQQIAYRGRLWRCWKGETKLSEYPTAEQFLKEYDLGEVIVL